LDNHRANCARVDETTECALTNRKPKGRPLLARILEIQDLGSSGGWKMGVA
jgi:hypothetical protein